MDLHVLSLEAAFEICLKTESIVQFPLLCERTESSSRSIEIVNIQM